MAKGINKVILIGNLGQDPDVRYSPNGTALSNISVATSESRKDNQSGEWQDHTEWHRVVLFGRTAEVAKEYLRKGSKVYIEGRLQTRKYVDKRDNIERYQTEILASDMQMLSSKSGGTAPMDDYGQVNMPRDSGMPRDQGIPRDQSVHLVASRPQVSPESSPDAGYDSDVPF